MSITMSLKRSLLLYRCPLVFCVESQGRFLAALNDNMSVIKCK